MENSAKIINLIFEPFPKSPDRILMISSTILSAISVFDKWGLLLIFVDGSYLAEQYLQAPELSWSRERQSRPCQVRGPRLRYQPRLYPLTMRPGDCSELAVCW